VLIYGRQRLRGTAALQVCSDDRCRKRMGPLPAEFLEGVRSAGAVKWG